MGLLDIFRRNKTTNEISSLAASLISDHLDAQSLLEFLQEHRSLRDHLNSQTHLLVIPQEDLVRLLISNVFVNYATSLSDTIGFGSISKEFETYNTASCSLLYAHLIFDKNPLAFACEAELDLKAQDRISARWAQKLIEFRPDSQTKKLLTDALPEGVYKEMMEDLRGRMRLVLEICAEHPDWMDSYSIKAGLTFYQRMLGGGER